MEGKEEKEDYLRPAGGRNSATAFGELLQSI